MKNQPTKEQIKEFWEWCGLKPPHLSCEEPNHMSIPSEYRKGEYFCLPVELDLNNLFKYAVPMLSAVELSYLYYLSGMTYRVKAFAKSGICREGWHKTDPTLALFWAIYGVIHEK